MSSRVFALGLVLLTGCPPPAAPPRTATEPPPEHRQKDRVKLAVLPVEGDVFPKLANGLNTQLAGVKMRAVDDYFMSKVTLEVVQLSIECVEATPQCYSAVGKSLAAQWLLFGSLAVRKHRHGVKVSLTLFDVNSSTVVKTTEREFKNDGEALDNVPRLLAEVVGPQ